MKRLIQMKYNTRVKKFQEAGGKPSWTPLAIYEHKGMLEDTSAVVVSWTDRK